MIFHCDKDRSSLEHLNAFHGFSSEFSYSFHRHFVSVPVCNGRKNSGEIFVGGLPNPMEQRAILGEGSLNKEGVETTGGSLSSQQSQLFGVYQIR